jgi:hypothetical protein
MINQSIAVVLVLAALVLLVSLGRLDLVLVVLPISLLLTLATAWSAHRGNRLTPRGKSGSLELK